MDYNEQTRIEYIIMSCFHKALTGKDSQQVSTKSVDYVGSPKVPLDVLNQIVNDDLGIISYHLRAGSKQLFFDFGGFISKISEHVSKTIVYSAQTDRHLCIAYDIGEENYYRLKTELVRTIETNSAATINGRKVMSASMLVAHISKESTVYNQLIKRGILLEDILGIFCIQRFKTNKSRYIFVRQNEQNILVPFEPLNELPQYQPFTLSYNNAKRDFLDDASSTQFKDNNQSNEPKHDSAITTTPENDKPSKKDTKSISYDEKDQSKNTPPSSSDQIETTINELPDKIISINSSQSEANILSLYHSKGSFYLACNEAKKLWKPAYMEKFDILSKGGILSKSDLDKIILYMQKLNKSTSSLPEQLQPKGEAYIPLFSILGFTEAIPDDKKPDTSSAVSNDLLKQPTTDDESQLPNPNDSIPNAEEFFSEAMIEDDWFQF